MSYVGGNMVQKWGKADITNNPTARVYIQSSGKEQWESQMPYY